MNAEDFTKYLYSHRGEALVGNPETLQVATKMESLGILTQVGSKDDKPIYRVTDYGRRFVEEAMKRFGSTKGAKVKSGLKTLGGWFQDYAEAYRRDNPVGMEDVRRTFGGMGSSDSPIAMPPRNILELGTERPREKALPKPKKKVEEFIKIDGKLFKKVDDET